MPIPQRALRAFAPASIGNLGPGFDVLGAALPGRGDHVEVRPAEHGIELTISGDDGALPTDPTRNCVGIAALEVLRRAGAETVGLSLHLEKGLPIGSGLGSSAASAAASAFAVNSLLGDPLTPHQLIEACVEAEAMVSGRHADNVAPAVLGGVVAVLSLDPLRLIQLPVPEGLYFASVTPALRLSTRAAREALPKRPEMATTVATLAAVTGLVAALHSGDLTLLGRSLDDPLAAPHRLPLIPGAKEAIVAAKAAGALGATISGAGPSLFAACDSAQSAERVGQAMVAAFGSGAIAYHGPAQAPGAHLVDS